MLRSKTRVPIWVPGDVIKKANSESLRTYMAYCPFWKESRQTKSNLFGNVLYYTKVNIALVNIETSFYRISKIIYTTETNMPKQFVHCSLYLFPFKSIAKR